MTNAWSRPHVGTLTRVMRFFIDKANTGNPADTAYATPADFEDLFGGAPGGEWATTATFGTGSTYFALSRPSFTRSGKATVAAGDVVTLTQRIELSTTSGNVPSISFDNLPIAADTGGGYPFPLRTIASTLQVVQVGGPTFVDSWDAVFVDSGTKINIIATGATSGDSVFEISMSCTYVALG